MKIQRKLLLTFLFICFMTGCPSERKEINPDLNYNAIIDDLAFQRLLENKKVIMVAPASGTELKNIDRIQFLTNFHINIPKNIISTSPKNIYHSNPDQVRLKLLEDAIFSNSNEIIWALRGGYGSARLLDELRKLPKPKKEKTFIGYSDNTALHLFFTQEWDWKTIHGAMLIEMLNPEKDPKNFQKLTELILTNADKLSLDDLKPLNNLAKDSTIISGKLTGGNLSIVQNSIGTFWQIKTAGKIVFFEDEHEPAYKINRLLHQLKQAGIFNEVKAIIFGEFTGYDNLDDELETFAQEIQVPVFRTNRVGHGRMNYPVMYNTYSNIQNKKNGNYVLEMETK